MITWAEKSIIRKTFRTTSTSLAIDDYSEAIRLRPDLVMAYEQRGIVRAENGDLAGSIADLTEAVKLDPSNAQIYFNRGLSRFNAGQREAAIVA